MCFMDPPLWSICKRFKFVQKVEVCVMLWGLPVNPQCIGWNGIAIFLYLWLENQTGLIFLREMENEHPFCSPCPGKASVEADGCCSMVGLSTQFYFSPVPPQRVRVATSAWSWSETQSCGKVILQGSTKIIKRAEVNVREYFNGGRDEQSVSAKKCNKADKPSRNFFPLCTLLGEKTKD